MYTSPDDDRSDLFLAAAVYVIGPEILGIILRWVPIPLSAAQVVRLLLVLITTVLVPFLLIRYRKQRWSDFGFGGPVSAAGLGVAASLPVIAAYLLGAFIRGGAAPPLMVLGGGLFNDVLGLVIDVVASLATMLLVIYVVTKARTSFRTDPAYIKPTMLHLGRFTAIAAAVATGLLMLSVVTNGVEPAAMLEVALPPLGVAAAAYVVYRGVRGSQLTSRAILLTPMVLLAIAAFTLFGQATEVVFGLWQATLLAGLGLIAAVLLESSRSAWAPLGFAAGLILTPLLG